MTHQGSRQKMTSQEIGDLWNWTCNIIKGEGFSGRQVELVVKLFVVTDGLLS